MKIWHRSLYSVVRIQFSSSSYLKPSAGEIDLDAAVMRTALLNIPDNAADACREGGAVQASRITFGVRADGAMDKAVLENLFDLFFSSKGHRGTGPGLFVAHRIVTQHQGTIHVTSKKGKGAHFRVVLPTRQEDQSAV